MEIDPLGATPRPRRDLPPPEKVDPEHPWSNDYSLIGARNAHRTNTRGQFQHGLRHGAHWLEGDVRGEIDHPEKLEMRHEPGHERGENLSLEEWLVAGVGSGRGLKLDFKEGERTPEILAELERLGVPDDRLMLNLRWADVQRFGAELRRRFPEAIVAVNPPAELTPEALEQMARAARDIGGRITFVLKEDRLTDESIRFLRPFGTISVWNTPGVWAPGDESTESRAAKLRARGVDGLIDLRREHMPWNLAGLAFDRAVGWLHDHL
ncbi:MAG: DUF2181 domain-containing protein [Candidatus Eremiobacterota bacterium]